MERYPLERCLGGFAEGLALLFERRDFTADPVCSALGLEPPPQKIVFQHVRQLKSSVSFDINPVSVAEEARLEAFPPGRLPSCRALELIHNLWG